MAARACHAPWKDQAYMSFCESSCKKSITVHATLIVPHERGGGYLVAQTLCTCWYTSAELC